MNIFPYVSCVFLKTMCPIEPHAENFLNYLKFHEESNEHGFSFQRQSALLVSGLFPVLEATYAKKNSIFEITGLNQVDPQYLFLTGVTCLENSVFMLRIPTYSIKRFFGQADSLKFTAYKNLNPKKQTILKSCLIQSPTRQYSFLAVDHQNYQTN